MWWKYLIGVLMAGVIVAAFVLPPPQEQIGDASRIFFFHVPAALAGFVAFVVAAVYGAVYLKTRNPAADRRAVASAEVGLTFSTIALITGAIFAKTTWGVYWNWDPRETTLLAVLLVYAAYFALRQAVANPSTRARLSAVYILLGGAAAPFLFFVLPRMYASLHPRNTLVAGGGEFTMNVPVGLTFAAALTTYVLLYLWLFQLADRAGRIREESDSRQEQVL